MSVVVNLSDHASRRGGKGPPSPEGEPADVHPLRERLLTQKELAQILRKDVRTVQRLQKVPGFPVQRYGRRGRPRYPEQRCLEFLRQLGEARTDERKKSAAEPKSESPPPGPHEALRAHLRQVAGGSGPGLEDYWLSTV